MLGIVILLPGEVARRNARPFGGDGPDRRILPRNGQAASLEGKINKRGSGRDR